MQIIANKETARYLTRLRDRNNRSGYKKVIGWRSSVRLTQSHYYRTTSGSILSVSVCFMIMPIKDLDLTLTRPECPICKAYLLLYPDTAQSEPQAS